MCAGTCFQNQQSTGIKSYMWGANPRAEVWASLTGVRGDYTNGTVSGCGYDKESAAVDLALKDNPLMQTLMMWPKLNVNTGYSGQVTRVVNKARLRV